ncbi:YqgE/AlgH family protein [Martelella sp. HB161492]|uniref:YqgE/AlgH family protein n=1 Tax=Martelella sp. HB161492 TaxID=2720726 RepID=UPI00158FD15F|nr:YqgE/AlgH family protein [Martelella sp. HB161492]
MSNFDNPKRNGPEAPVLTNLTTRRERGPFDGQFLIAMPQLEDDHFQRSVVYICAHSPEGTMGFVLNRTLDVSFSEVLAQVKLTDGLQAQGVPRHIADFKVQFGGPVEPGRGFVLHSDDYSCDTSIPVSDDLCLTATLDVLRVIAEGRGPARAALYLGYASWGPGQLEAEIANNDWLTCPATDSIIFDDDFDSKYERALLAMGVEPSLLSSKIGHA